VEVEGIIALPSITQVLFLLDSVLLAVLVVGTGNNQFVVSEDRPVLHYNAAQQLTIVSEHQVKYFYTMCDLVNFLQQRVLGCQIN
jgi:hypothetical protein